MLKALSHLISSGCWSVPTVLRSGGPELQVCLTELYLMLSHQENGMDAHLGDGFPKTQTLSCLLGVQPEQGYVRGFVTLLGFVLV